MTRRRVTYRCPRCHAGVILAVVPEHAPCCVCGLIPQDNGTRKARRPPIEMEEVPT